MPKISVIVPVYKTAKYLPKCLDSILNQTFKDFEIILVSDGPQEEHKLCDEYAKKDNRIIVIKDIKKDLGGARNAGIKIAKGKYICSIDSDDFIEPTYLEKMYNAITSSDDIDIVQCGTEIVFEGAVDEVLKEHDERYFAIKHNGVIDCGNIIFGTINVGTWNKLYKKEIIDKYNICFPENLRNEDAYFTWAYWMVSNKMYCIPDKLYNYLRRDDSLMAVTFKKGLGKKVLDHLKVGSLLYDFLIKNKLFEKRKSGFFRAFVICWCFARDNGEKKYVKKARSYVRKFFKNKEQPLPEPELMNIILSYRPLWKKIIANIFSLRNKDRHKVLTILGLKIKFKRKKKTLSSENVNNQIKDEGNNNKIILIKENGEEELLNHNNASQISRGGVIIIIRGNNNTIKLHEPLKFNNCYWDIESNNNYFEIGSPVMSINSLYIKSTGGDNQKFIVKKPIFISSMAVFLAEEKASVVIEDNMMSSMDVKIMPTDGHPIFNLENNERINKIKNEVHIGKNVWLGYGVFIGKNVQIPNNTIIGAKAVVCKSFEEENTAIAGNPAKVVKRNVSWHYNLKSKVPLM